MPAFLEACRDYPVRKVSAGETIFEQGGNTGQLFVLIEGAVEVVKDGVRIVSSGTPGDIFGDLSALLKIPHIAALRTVRDSSFYVIADPVPFLERNPAVCLQLCELLARRMVSVTEYLLNVKEQFSGHDHLGLVDGFVETLLHRHPRARVKPRDSSLDLP